MENGSKEERKEVGGAGERWGRKEEGQEVRTDMQNTTFEFANITL